MENLVHYFPCITVKIHSLPLLCLLKEQESKIPQLDACNEASASFNNPCSTVNIIITFQNYSYWVFFRKSLLKIDFTSDFPFSVNLKVSKYKFIEVSEIWGGKTQVQRICLSQGLQSVQIPGMDGRAVAAQTKLPTLNTGPGKCKDPFPKTSLDHINYNVLELIFN